MVGGARSVPSKNSAVTCLVNASQATQPFLSLFSSHLTSKKLCRLCFRDATHPSSPPLLGYSSSGSSSHSVSVWSRQTVPGKRFSQSARHSERGGNAHPRRRCGRQGVHFRLLRYRPKAASLLCLSLGEDMRAAS